MAELDKIYLFRMTHIENIPHILKFGITHSKSVNANPKFKSIGDSSLIQNRNNFLLDNGKHLGDYIPFYFGGRMPMLYVIQKGYNSVTPTPAENIVYCISSVQEILDLKLDFVFTDGHAVNSFTTQYSVADIQNIDNLIDMEAINAKYWINDNDLDLKRRKEAEFLVFGDIPALDLGFIVYNQQAKDKLLQSGVLEDVILIDNNYYF